MKNTGKILGINLLVFAAYSVTIWSVEKQATQLWILLVIIHIMVGLAYIISRPPEEKVNLGPVFLLVVLVIFLCGLSVCSSF